MAMTAFHPRRPAPAHAAAALLVLAAASAACTFVTKFWEYDDRAPIKSVAQPPEFEGVHFGRTIAAFSTEKPAGGAGQEVDGDFVAVAGDAPSEIVVHELAKGDEVASAPGVLLRVPQVFEEADREALSGASFAPIDTWQFGGEVRKGCLVVGKPGANAMTIHCIDASATFTYTVDPGGEAAGRSVDAVAKSAGVTPEGYVVGARGRAYWVPSSFSPGATKILQGNSETGTPDDLGASVVAGRTGSSSMPWLAVGSKGKVLVWAWLPDPAQPAASAYFLADCIEKGAGGGAGFGTRLAAIDADKDGVEDLFIGSAPDGATSDGRLTIVSGDRFKDIAAVPEHTLCEKADDVAEKLAQLSCADDAAAKIECGAASLFGASVAAGDPDADGTLEIAVGAPGATVDGVSGAGALFLFRLSSPSAPVAALRTASPSEDQHLGESVAMVSVAGRDELAAGAPGGSGRLMIFYCTGLPGDAWSSGNTKCR